MPISVLLLAALLPASSAFSCRPPPLRPEAGRTPTLRCAADELSILASLSESYWVSRKARLQAEMEAKLRELDEFQEREKALSAVALPAAPVPAGVLPAASAALEAELVAEKERSAALEKELAAAKLETELAVQKTAAFWIEKLAEAKAGSAGAPSAATSTTAPPPKPSSDVLPADGCLVDPGLTLRELRLRLLQYNLSTIGLKSELVARLDMAMRSERLQHKNWDPEVLVWK